MHFPVLSTSGADSAALRILGASRVGIVTPFNAEVVSVVRASTKAAGFDTDPEAPITCLLMSAI